MSYFVYENDPQNYTLIHRSGCNNNWASIAMVTPSNERDRRWRGPYQTLSQASGIAKQTRKNDVRR